LKVKSRNFSSVGGYINFYLGYSNQAQVHPGIPAENLVLSAPYLLRVRGTDDYMSFELDVTKGKINFIELVVDGNWVWDLSFDNLELIEYKF
jgi:hypothetical protein